MVDPTTNSSGPVDTSQPNWQLYNVVDEFSIVYLSFLALGTIAANGFTLYAIYKDPLKCFRTPLTIFITAIIVSDFLTGLIVEPVLAAWKAIDFRHIGLLRSIQVVSMITINTSFFIILALAVAQLMALAIPIVYDQWLTNRSAKIIVACIWTYSCLFSVLPEIFNMSLSTFYKIDLILNITLVTIALIVVYLITYVVFKRSVTQLGENIEHPQPANNQQPNEKVEKDFLKGTFILTMVLIITVWPFMITLYIWIFNPYVNMAAVVDEYIALIICEDVLYLKFLWDPLIFILRVAKYRKAVVLVFSGVIQRCGCVQGGAGVAVYNRHANEETRIDDVQEVTVVEEDDRDKTINENV
jgi:hypothetical protein